MTPDWLLIYAVTETELVLVRTGSHEWHYFKDKLKGSYCNKASLVVAALAAIFSILSLLGSMATEVATTIRSLK
ncbi:hypothetical protein [Coraliomargarita parva]|uniref:hypothetical protein n=1 Tax=Coraliomargarita parva TaxID=3014050 RepID=UPI0031F329B6